MPVRVARGKADASVRDIVRLLERYQAEHPDAEIDVYRKSRFSIRIRIIDPEFRPLSRSQRSQLVWPLLRELPEETLADVSMVLLISPEERESSLGSQEFDDPLPSRR
jgi:hypothetical protein